jgi:hypothetical protein
VTSGALLVISLLLDWWGVPGGLIDPPADAPKEIQFMADAYRQAGPVPAHDGFEFYDFRDVVWLVTGIAAFGFGLATLLELRGARALGLIAGVLGLLSAVTIAAALIWPPDLLELGAEQTGQPQRLDYDLPLSHKIGGWLALISSLGVASVVRVPTIAQLALSKDVGDGSSRT